MNRYIFTFLFCVLLIFSMGLLMVFNTTSAEVLDRSLAQSTHFGLFKQLSYACIAVILAAIVGYFGYENLLRYSKVFLWIGVVFLILVFVPGIGQQINGAHRWMRFMGISFQPSEFVKYLIPLFYIEQITKRNEPMDLKSFLILLATAAIPIGLILIEPDNGTVAIIIAGLVVLFVLTRIRWIYWALPLLILAIIGGLAASQMKHVPDRIRVYLHPESDLRGKGHQPYQAKIAAGSGQLWGKGLGESLQKLDYLPEARSDYIAAIYAEEFGYAGIIALLFLYMLIGYLGFYMASCCKDMKGFYVTAVFTFLLCFQAFLNLGVVSGLLPSKGTNLPFFSQGGSSLFANFMTVAVILNIAHRSGKKYVTKKWSK